MKVSARFPFSAYIMADGPDALSPVTDFTYKRVQVRVEFDGENPLEVRGEPPTHFRRLTGLRIEVTGDEVLKRLVNGDNRWPLLDQLVDIANRVMVAIRNFGLVAHLEPLRVSEPEVDRWLRVLR